MSGQPYRYASDVEKYRNEYMNSLNDRASLDDMVLQAVKTYVATGTLPAISSIPDTRTTSEKLMDVEKLKQEIIKDFSPIMSATIAQSLIQGLIQSPLNVDNRLLIFTAQRAPELANELRKKYKYGIKGDTNDIYTFVEFINNMFADKANTTASIKSMIDSGFNSKSRGIINKSDLDDFKASLVRVFSSITSSAIGDKSDWLITNIGRRITRLNAFLPSSANFEQDIQQLLGRYADLDDQGFNDMTHLISWMRENLPNKEFLFSLSSGLWNYISDANRNRRPLEGSVIVDYLTRIYELLPELPEDIARLADRFDDNEDGGDNYGNYDNGEGEEEDDEELRQQLPRERQPLPNRPIGQPVSRQPTRMSERLARQADDISFDADLRGFQPSLEDYPLEEEFRMENPLLVSERIPYPEIERLSSALTNANINTGSKRISKATSNISSKLREKEEEDRFKSAMKREKELQDEIRATEREFIALQNAYENTPESMTKLRNSLQRQFLEKVGVLETLTNELDALGSTTGNGLPKKRRGRPKGSGIKRPIEELIDTSSGIKQDPKFTPFGKFLLHNGKIRENIISLKNIKGGNIIGIPSTKVSHQMAKVIKTIIGGGLPSFNDMNTLSNDEKSFLHKISTKANIIDKLNIPTPSKDQEEKDLHQFEVMKGEIMAGNDSDVLVKKFKALLLKLSKNGTLPKAQVSEILTEILQLGY